MPSKPVGSNISQGYGPSKYYYGGFGITVNGGYYHNGIDYASPCGTSVKAPEAGTVYQQYEPNGYGVWIRFIGDSGWTHDLGHLQGYSTANGAHVAEGTVIGKSGTTGNSSGCHLHWTTKKPGYNNNDGKLGASDPSVFLNLGGSVPDLSDANHKNKVEAIRGFIFRITGTVHNDKDIVDNHIGTEAVFSPTEQENLNKKFYGPLGEKNEYYYAVQQAYNAEYGSDTTMVEVDNKRRARIGVPDLRLELMKNPATPGSEGLKEAKKISDDSNTKIQKL